MNIIPMWPHLSIFSINNLPFIFFSGVDVTANQEEISDHETFQLEYDDMSKRWYIRTMQDKYFTQKPGGGIQANEIRRYDISRFYVQCLKYNQSFQNCWKSPRLSNNFEWMNLWLKNVENCIL